MSALPYLATLAVVIAISRRGRKGPTAPSSLGSVRAGPVMAGDYRPINCYVCAIRLCSGSVTAISVIGEKGDRVHLYEPKFVLAALCHLSVNNPPIDAISSPLAP